MNKRYFLLLLLTFTLFSFATAKTVVTKNLKSEQLTDAAKRQFDYYFYEAIRLKNDEKYDQALETLRLCETLNPNDAGLQSELGMLYGAIGMKEEATSCFEMAVRLDPQNWWYNVRLITLHSELNHIKRALEVTNALQKVFPNKEDVYQMQASLYKETGEWIKAIAAFDKLESLMGVNEAISTEKIQLYLAAKKPKKSLLEIDKLISKFPTESRYKVLRGNFFMQQKNPQLAYTEYQKVLADDPQNAYVYVSLSQYYKANDEPEKALESIVNALKNEQLDVDTKMLVLGQYIEKLVRDSTKLSESESLFKLLVDRYPLEEQVHGYYAAFLQFRRRIPEAISELETMININPQNEQTWLQLIQLHTADRDYKRILEVSSQAILKLPKVPTWYLYQGIAHFQLAEYDEALKSYETALPLVTDDKAAMREDLYAQIADTYYKQGNRTEAFEAYEKVLAQNPRNIMAMNNYAYYLSLEKKDLKKAERMSAKTVELEPNNSTYLDTYAWILYQQASYSLAKFYIEKAMDNLPKEDDPGIILEHYGDILWMSGSENDAKALEVWQKSYDAGNKTEELKAKIDNKGWKRE